MVTHGTYARCRRGTLTRVALLLAGLLLWGPAASETAQAAVPTMCSAADLHGDPRLGPVVLPKAGPLAPMLKGYRRFGGMSSQAYLKRYYNAKKQAWRYPPLGGYQLMPPTYRQVKLQVSLFAGQLIDVFGDDGGTYLAPAGTPYGARSIPPQTLDSTTDPAGCNYLLYRVVREFPVYSGPIAPGLAQPGFGLQYVLNQKVFFGSAPPPAVPFDIGYLVDNGYLVEVTP